MKKRTSKFCTWCGKLTVMEPMLLPETPILEFMEEKINEFGRDEIWGDDGDWSSIDMDSDFEAELLVYDQMLTTVSEKVVCVNCLKHDDDLWNKYYNTDDEGGDAEIIFDSDF